jgi:hypothetical protein
MLLYFTQWMSAVWITVYITHFHMNVCREMHRRTAIFAVQRTFKFPETCNDVVLLFCFAGKKISSVSGG